MKLLLCHILIFHAVCFANAKSTADLILLDVRTHDEYVEEHAKSALNMDINRQDFDKRLSKLDKNKKFYVYCRSGGRASLAVKKMKKMGFKFVTNLKTLENAQERFGK